MKKIDEIWPLVLGSTILLVLVGLFFLMMLYIFNKRQVRFKVEKKLIESQHQETLLKSQLEIQEQTLQNISEEIHDNIIQLLSLSKLNMNAILQTDSADAKTTARETKNILSKAIYDLRSLSHHLNGTYILQKGLYNSILSAFNSFGTHILLQTSVTLTGEEFPIGGNREIVLFRIFQEALNNSMKHAKAKAFSVELKYEAETFIMQLLDNGKGFDVSTAKNGIGLQNIKKRAALINAKFELQSQPSEGTHIRLTLNKNDGKPRFD